MNVNVEDKDFSNDFRQFYRKELDIYMNDLEKERKKFLSLIIYILIFACISLIFLIKFSLSINDFKIIGYYLALVSLLITWTVKKYKTNVKGKILPKLLSYIGEFKIEKEEYSKEQIRNLNIFPVFDNISYDDRIKGIYKLLSIDIIELKLSRKYERSSSEIFQGILIKVPCNKRFGGVTVIKPILKNLSYSINILDKEVTFLKNDNKPKFETVNLEDAEFNKYYDVISTDQIEARYLITTAFMNRMLNIAKNKSKSTYSVSFEDGFVYIAVNTPNKDWFEVPILKPAADINNYKAIIFEIIQIMKIIDALKLEQKIGL